LVLQGYRQLQFLEAQQIDTDEANLVAGMDIAMDIVRAAETVGGAVTPSDLLLLTSGALAERNVNAAAGAYVVLFVPWNLPHLYRWSLSNPPHTDQDQGGTTRIPAHNTQSPIVSQRGLLQLDMFCVFAS
jgi:hypothetical protein